VTFKSTAANQNVRNVGGRLFWTDKSFAFPFLTFKNAISHTSLHFYWPNEMKAIRKKVQNNCDIAK